MICNAFLHGIYEQKLSLKENSQKGITIVPKDNKKGSADAFRYSFTPSELKTYLFHAKKCPVCSGPLRKEKTYEVVEGKKLNGKGDPFFVANARVKHYLYKFHCEKCGKTFTLEEITEKRKG